VRDVVDKEVITIEGVDGVTLLVRR